MKVFVIIPARYHSTRFEGKALVPISGKPLIQYSYERSLSSSTVSYVAVATDDERIFQCVRNFGGNAIMTGAHHKSGTERVAEAASHLSLQDSDVIINVQGDQIIFFPGLIDQLAQTLKEYPKVPMATPVKKIMDVKEINDPNCVKVTFDKNGFALYFSRSPIPFPRDKSANLTYYKHLGIYAYRRPFLKKFVELPQGLLETTERLEQLRVLEHGYRIKVIETPYEAMEVNTKEDLEKIEKALTPYPDQM
ncbi:MAG TPA: 3-deoxy-manno-octulosonate cytidylyltransferase [Syntrophaceae bacterium]|nr:3-deoxy-manno-octulosonate cytidylyltransferase [Syntrophaceae bacterium]